MPPSLRRWLRRRSLPPPDRAEPDALWRWWEVGAPGERALALRYLALHEAPVRVLPAARAALAAPEPLLRSAAAWVLGSARGDDDAALGLLWAALRTERTDTVRRLLAVAAVRRGAPVAAAWGTLAAAAERQVATPSGPRRPAAGGPDGIDSVAVLWRRALSGGDTDAPPDRVAPVPAGRLRRDALDALDRDPEDREATRVLALQQHPADAARFVAEAPHVGRRAAHQRCEAMGLHGDVRSLPALVGVLRAVDVDPGHGFAGRRAAGIALGRIGDPSSRSALVQALIDEAHDHEGRPGAGLGIQFPVRSVLIAALGEAGCVEAAPVVAGYLGDRSGSALGGFFLPAMDAAWKLGRTGPLLDALSGPLPAAAHAVGVLALIGQLDRVRTCLDDPRAEVRRTAALALDLRSAAQGAPNGLPDA